MVPKDKTTLFINPMVMHTLVIAGNQIFAKQTHYQVMPFLHGRQVTISIRYDTAGEFKQKYHIGITTAHELLISVDLGENQARVKECQDAFKPPNHLMGTVRCLDDIVYNALKTP